MDELCSDYAVLTAQIKELTKLKDAKKLQIVEHMAVNGENKIQNDFGSFTISKLKTWEYPAYITKMEDDFKAAQEKSKTTGEAVIVEEVSSLRFTPVNLNL